MFIVWLIKNSGPLLLIASAAGIVFLILRARILASREQKAEAAEAAAKAARIRKQQEQAAQEAAAKAVQEAARKESARKAATAREAAQKAAKEAKQAAREARQAEADKRQAARLEAARMMAEYRERALAAAQKLKDLESAPASPAARTPVQLTPQASAPAPDNAPKPFAGQRVSFTGKLKSMTRPQAAELVQNAGGKAFVKAMPAGTTLLVVGDTGGSDTNKLEKADEWIGQVRKITESQFLAMFAQA